ncbi:MAG: AbrB/MazE/SpoVT family DNA-binding domain-containing protein [bacterium]|nr:AbrB/MazE/SpoVT family DNA-binding domain-containing protein [bacterium]
MKRSVILMGGKTFVLSLPAAWIKKYQIQKGEELDLEEKDNAIIVRTDNKPFGKELDIDFSVLDLMLNRGLGAIYKAGYTKAKIHFQTKEQLQKIEETLQRTLIGFEITKQEKNYVLIESLAEIKAEEFAASLKRLFYSLEMMNEELTQALVSGDLLALQKVVAKDGQINRLADFCRRVINSGQIQFLHRPAVLYYLVEQLERIGDIYKNIAQLAIDKKIISGASSQKLFAEINTIFIQYRTLFFKFDLVGFEDFGKKFYDLRKKIDTLQSQKQNKELDLFYHQKYLLETIIDMNGALLTLNI